MHRRSTRQLDAALRRPAVRAVAVVSLLGSLLGLGSLPAAQAAAPIAAGRHHRVAAAASGGAAVEVPSRVIEGPAGSGYTLTVTPGDLSKVERGDTVHLHFAGMTHFAPGKKGRKGHPPVVDGLFFVGMCPTGLPATAAPAQLVSSCRGRYDTGLLGAPDPDNSTTNPGLSTAYESNSASMVLPRADGTLDVDVVVGAGKDLVAPPTTEANTCDADHACVIGFALGNTTLNVLPAAWTDVASLQVAPRLPAGDDTGCADGDAATVAVSGAAELDDWFVAMNRGACARKAGTHLPVSASPVGEDQALTAIKAGTADAAVLGSALASSAPAGFVKVPVALSAEVVVQKGGGREASLSDPTWPGLPNLTFNTAPLAPLTVTPAALAAIVLHDYLPGQSGFVGWGSESPDAAVTGPANHAFAALNAVEENKPLLAGADAARIGVPLASVPTMLLGVGRSTPASVLSSYLKAKAPQSWVFPDLEYNHTPDPAKNPEKERAGKAVGVIDDFQALVDDGILSDSSTKGPRLTTAVATNASLWNWYFDRDTTALSNGSDPSRFRCPSIGEQSAPQWAYPLKSFCLKFAVMDAATAARFGFTTSRLGEAGAAALPTAQTMAKAAEGQLTTDGWFDAPAGGYPLTFVQYALVPTTKLVDEADDGRCTVRTEAIARLKDWLGYAVGDGQAQLPPGYAPLTSALKAEATDAIAKVASGGLPATCATPTPRPTATSTDAGSNSGSDTGSDDGSGGSGAGSGSGDVGSGDVPPLPVDSASVDGTLPTLSSSPSPSSAALSAAPVAFTTMRPAGATPALIGTLLLIALVSAAALTAGLLPGLRNDP